MQSGRYSAIKLVIVKSSDHHKYRRSIVREVQILRKLSLLKNNHFTPSIQELLFSGNAQSSKIFIFIVMDHEKLNLKQLMDQSVHNESPLAEE